MDPLEPQPPAPPRPELIAPNARPTAATLTIESVQADFFQQRIAMLERELTAERERAAAASNMLTQQEALKSEVERHLKGLSEQLRREKAERDGEEAKQHARGRVEALERRLDEMNATFASLLKEAVARQASAAANAPVEDHLSRQLEEFTAKLQDTLADWERRHDLEQRRQDDRLQSLCDERAALSKRLETQGQSTHREFLKERIARETALSDQIAQMAKRLDGVDRGQREVGAGSASVREALDQVVRILTATPKAKDEIIVELEAEKNALLQAMRKRREQLHCVLGEHRDIERTMGESLIALSAELEQERARTRAADARAGGFNGDVETLKARVCDLECALRERDARAQSLGAERDELTRALVGEAEKVRLAISERAAAEERWHQRMLELQRKFEEEAEHTGQAAACASGLRAQAATLSEQMARALQERDGIIARYADWERERQRLLDALKKKDEMIAMLSSAFQSSLKKP